MKHRFICAALIPVLLAGCKSTKPPPAPPPTIAEAQSAAAQAAKLSEARNWTAAAHEWQLALDHFHLLNDRTDAAIALHNLAQAQRELGHPEAAPPLLEEAARINEQLGRRAQWWRNQIALLQVESALGLTNQPRSRFERLAPMASQLQDQSASALFLNELGLWQQSRGDLTNALASFRQAAQKFTALKDRAGNAAALGNQARVEELQQRYPAALNAWQAALAGFEAVGDTHGIAGALLGLGRTRLSARQNLAAAEDLLRRAARNYQLLKSIPGRQTALQALRDCLLAEGKQTDAETVRRELQQLSQPPPAKPGS